MRIDWENIRWETDEFGTSWATLPDDEHNYLMIGSRDGAITFRTDGDPSFDTSRILDITTLCLMMSKESLADAGGVVRGDISAGESQARHWGMRVPEPRHVSQPQQRGVTSRG